MMLFSSSYAFTAPGHRGIHRDPHESIQQSAMNQASLQHEASFLEKRSSFVLDGQEGGC